MKILLIGGTGKISMALSKQLLKEGHELYLSTRGRRNEELENCSLHSPISLIGDIHNEQEMESLLSGLHFDAVADFIAFHRSDLERDYRLFRGKTRQFLFISSASAYQKPLANYRITESTPLANPYWEYSKEKIECENYLMHLYRTEQFPVTIVRPSSTYDERSIPAGIHGKKGSYSTIKRKPNYKNEKINFFPISRSLFTETVHPFGPLHIILTLPEDSLVFWEISMPLGKRFILHLTKP